MNAPEAAPLSARSRRGAVYDASYTCWVRVPQHLVPTVLKRATKEMMAPDEYVASIVIEALRASDG